MKKSIVALSVLMVLLFSGFTRADEPGFVEDVYALKGRKQVGINFAFIDQYSGYFTFNGLYGYYTSNYVEPLAQFSFLSGSNRQLFSIAGGMKLLYNSSPNQGKIIPFIQGGAGVNIYSGGSDDDTFAYLTLGGGVHMFLNYYVSFDMILNYTINFDDNTDNIFSCVGGFSFFF